MLAYLFWHAAPDGASAADYERTVVHFGSALADAAIPGLLGNASYAIARRYRSWCQTSTRFEGRRCSTRTVASR